MFCTISLFSIHTLLKTICLEVVVGGWFIDNPDVPRRVWVGLSSTVPLFPPGNTDTLWDCVTCASIIWQLSSFNRGPRACHQGEVQYPGKQEFPRTSSIFEPSRHHQQRHRRRAYRSRTYRRSSTGSMPATDCGRSHGGCCRQGD
jgi:hypothetical protein